MGGLLPTFFLGLLGLLLVLAGIEDARRREIANATNIAIAVLALPWWWSLGLSPWPDMAAQAGAAALVFALFLVPFAFGMMGGGDVKMIAALSLWLPFTLLVWMLVLMSLLGGLLTLAMLADQRLRRNTAPPEVPYGVAVALAGLLCLREPILNHFL